jgi:DHA1 family tetracycline resistance protein-like MFS transporter
VRELRIENCKLKIENCYRPTSAQGFSNFQFAIFKFQWLNFRGQTLEMSKSRSPLVIIFITIFIDLVGFGIVIPVLPLYAERYGASEATVGVLLAIYSAMQFIFAPILGKLSDRIGRRPVLLVSLIGTSMGFLIMGLAPRMPVGFALLGMAPTLVWLFIARIIDGISGGNISTAQAYIADVTPPEQRSRGMGLIGAAFGLGFIFGPAIGGLMSHISAEAPFFFASAMAAANATALYFLLPESLSHEHRSQAQGRVTVAQIFAQAGDWHLKAIMATYFFGTVAFAMLTATYALFANHRFNFDAIHTGYMFTYVGVLGAVIQGGLLGRLVKMFGEKPLAIVGTAVFAASVFALPSTATLTTLLLASTGIAIGNSLMTPTLNGLASKSVSAAWQGRMLGVMASVASLARIIGPVLGGWLLSLDADPAGHYGRSPYWTSAAIMLMAFALAMTIRAHS